MDDRTRHQAAVDAMLDRISELLARITNLEEQLAYKDHELMNCYESTGIAL